MSKPCLILKLVEKMKFTSSHLSGVRCLSNAAPAGLQTKEGKSLDPEWDHARPFEELPGPKPLPLIGTTYLFFPKIGELSGGDLYRMQMTLYKKYGKMCRVGLPNGKYMVPVFDPDWIEKALRNEGPWPIRESINSLRYYRHVTRKDFFEGNAGLIVEQGEPWHTFRSKVNQPMMQPKTTKLYVKPINDVAKDFIEKIYVLRDSNMEMPDNFLNELSKWSLESIAMVALDARLGCLDVDLKPDSEPQRLIDSVQVMIDSFASLDFQIPFWRLFPTPTWRRFVKAMDYFTEVSSKYIYKAVDKLKLKSLDSDEDMTFLQRLLARDSNSKTAIIMALDMLMGGIDTTSITVANFLYHLARSPEKQEILYEEVTRIAPSKEAAITAENLEDMKYLKACFKEVMRVSPVVIGSGRTMVNDIVIGNYRIPKGTMVSLPFMILSQMEEYFPEAKKFIPERWLKSRDRESSGGPGSCSVSAEKTHPFVSLPFGFGPRMCIGRRFAELEVMTLIAKLMQHFKVEYHYGEMTYTHRTVNKPTKPLKFRFLERT